MGHTENVIRTFLIADNCLHQTGILANYQTSINPPISNHLKTPNIGMEGIS